MKNFLVSPIFAAVAAVVVLAGCAGTSTHQTQAGSKSMGVATPGKDNPGQGGCPCCNMDKGGMSSDGKAHGMGMMQGSMPSQAGAMCKPKKGEGSKGDGGCSCCGMSGGGCKCCGMDKKEMSPEMHKKHMEMMKQHHPHMMQEKTPVQPAVK